MTRLLLRGRAGLPDPFDRPTAPARQWGGRIVDSPLDVRPEIGSAATVADDLGVGLPRLRVDADASDVIPGHAAEGMAAWPGVATTRPTSGTASRVARTYR